MNKIINFSKRNAKESLRDPILYIFCLGFPLVMLVIFNVLNKYTQNHTPMFSMRALLPGIICFSYTFIMLSTSLLVSKDRQTSFLKRLYSSPMKSYHFTLGYAIVGIVIGLAQTLICVLCAFIISLITGEAFISFGQIILLTLTQLPMLLINVFLGILFVPMFAAGIVMMVKNPELLKKRLNAKEKQQEQNLVVKLSGLMFLAGFIVAGLDFRFSWFVLPDWVSYATAGVFLLAYVFYAEVLRENTYLSRTIEVQENQKVIDTGLYGIVRHPMYSATILLFLSMPLVLGSAISFVIFLAYPVIIAMRIKNEEKVLEEGLEGYSEYKKKVKYRMLPFIW